MQSFSKAEVEVKCLQAEKQIQEALKKELEEKRNHLQKQLVSQIHMLKAWE